MNGVARIDRDVVLAELRAAAVISRFGIAGHRCADEFRTHHCPSCGPRSRDSVAINLETGRWQCFAHGCHGDVLSLVAGFAGIDPRRDFTRVLELAADIAGVTRGRDPGELARSRRESARHLIEHRDEQRRVAEQRRSAAVAQATTYWDRLAPSSIAGEAYVAGRGVFDVIDLGFVRFTTSGAIAIALKTADARIVNVVRRRITDGEPKVLGMKSCPTAGTFVDSIADIAHGRDVVLVEGVFDALTARLAWPNAVILGAHGANNLPRIAAAAAPRMQLARTRLLLVPHDDDAGANAMIAAGRHAQDAGLRAGERLFVVDVGAKDLNDAWRTGWRPTR